MHKPWFKKKTENIGQKNTRSSERNNRSFERWSTFISPSATGEKSVRSELKHFPAPPPQTESFHAPQIRIEVNGLETKYIKLGKLVGNGDGGSVQLVERKADGTIFAAKHFNGRKPFQEEREHVRRIIVEFGIGLRLRHENIIDTLELIREDNQWYEVMEYAPYCLFERVNSGDMSLQEIRCSFSQVLAGVEYLHGKGFAHRDLKLDNVVVTVQGVMKIIDFGDAVVCRHPLTKDVIFATDVIGTLPYMAPEVFHRKGHDPQSADVWSLAIMYCSMILRRFPWKAANLSDERFKLFAAVHGSERDQSNKVSRLCTKSLPHHGSKQVMVECCELIVVNTDTTLTNDTDLKRAKRKNSSEQLPGSWRLLRLLPDESRKAIAGMLQIDVKNRLTLSQVMEDSWVRARDAPSSGTSDMIYHCGLER